MKTSKYTHEARTLIRAGKPTGYTLAAEIVANSTGRVSVSGGVPVHWFQPWPDTRSLIQRRDDIDRRIDDRDREDANIEDSAVEIGGAK